MQKLARTLNAAEKPMKLIHDTPINPASEHQCRRLMASAEAIVGLADAAALLDVSGLSATTPSPPSSKIVAA
jgi:hypothetical protein